MIRDTTLMLYGLAHVSLDNKVQYMYIKLLLYY